MRVAPWVRLAGPVLASAILLFGVPSPTHAGADEDQPRTKVEKKVIIHEPDRDMEVEDAEEDGDADDGGSGYLGVQVQNLSSALRRAKNLPGSVEGALVGGVSDGGPAEAAGVQRGDVIVEVNRTPIDDASSLTGVVRELSPGSKVSVVVYRGGTRKTLTVVIGSRRGDMDMPEPTMPPNWQWNKKDMPHPMVRKWDRDDRELQRHLGEIHDELARIHDELQEIRMQLKRMAPPPGRSRGGER